MGKRKFNFFKDVVSPVEKIANRAAKTLAPVAKPIIGALTHKAVQGVESLPVKQAVPVAVASMKKGGMIKPKAGKKTMLVKAHAGELVVPKHLVSKVPKTVKDKIKKGGGKDMK